MDKKIFLSEVQWWLWWWCCPFTFCNTHSTVSAGGIFMPLMWSLSITFTFSSSIIFTSEIVFTLTFQNLLFVCCCILLTIFYFDFSISLFLFTWGIKCSCVYAYLIFVIFFTRAKLLENKIYTKKRVNYDKIHSKLPIFCVITAKYTVNCQFFALNL